MKAGDVNVVQYDTEHGGFRVLPLRSLTDIGRMEMLRGQPHTWICVGYATDEGKSFSIMQSLKKQLKEAEKSA